MMTTISINLGGCALFRNTAGRYRGVFPLPRASGTFTNAVVEAQMIAVERDRLLPDNMRQSGFVETACTEGLGKSSYAAISRDM